jgi:hypothetical protein
MRSAVRFSQNVASIFITDDEVLELGFEQTVYEASESNSSAVVCIEMKAGSSEVPISLSLSTRSLSAQVNKDYNTSVDQVMLLPHKTSTCVTAINIIDDTALEVSENLTVSISPPEGLGRLHISQPTTIITITDDDDIEVGLDSSSYTVNEDYGSLRICVVIVGNYELGTEVTLELNTIGETAQVEQDFVRLSERITLSPTVSEQCLSVEIVNDSATELNESLILSLSVFGEWSRVHIFPPAASIFITDDDELSVALRNNYTVTEADGNTKVCVEVLAGELGTNITLQLATHSGTAEEEVDYHRLAETVTLNSTSDPCVLVAVVNDLLYEDTEFLTVSLSINGQLKHAVHVSQEKTTISITNDDEISVDFKSRNYATNESAEGTDVCVSIVNGLLGTNITLKLNSARGTAKANDDFAFTSSFLTLSPTKSEDCVRVLIVDDEVVEANETIIVSLSQIGLSNRLHIPEEPVSLDIVDDDVAVVGLEQIVTVNETGAFRFVNVCAVTNNTLERTLHLNVIIAITSESDVNVTGVENDHTLELQPDNTRSCISINITVEEELSFYVRSDEDGVLIRNPNGTVVREPSFDEIHKLLTGKNVDLQEIVKELNKIVDTLIKNEQTASRGFSSVSAIHQVLQVLH